MKRTLPGVADGGQNSRDNGVPTDAYMYGRLKDRNFRGTDESPPFLKVRARGHARGHVCDFDPAAAT